MFPHRATATIKLPRLNELLKRAPNARVTADEASVDQYVREVASGLPLVKGALQIRALLDALQAEIYLSTIPAKQAALCHVVERILSATGNYSGFGYATRAGTMLEIPVERDPNHFNGYRIAGGRAVQDLPGYAEYCRHFYISSRLAKVNS